MQALNQYCESKQLPRPQMKDIWSTGPDHCRTWHVRCPMCEMEFAAVGRQRDTMAKCAEHMLHELQQQRVAQKTAPVPTTVVVSIHNDTAEQVLTNISPREIQGPRTEEDEVTLSDAEDEPRHAADDDGTGEELKYFNEFFQKQGLARPCFNVTSTGPPHCPTWFASILLPSFSHKTKSGAVARCAQEYVTYLQSFAMMHMDLPTFEVKIEKIVINTKSLPPFIGVEAFDLEWNIAKTKRVSEQERFVCGVIARSENEMYFYTDYDLLQGHLRSICTCVAFAIEQDRKMFPELFRQIPRVRDVRTILPPNVYSKTVGLASLVRLCLHKHLKKELQLSFENKDTLTTEQIQYVACDALATLLLYNRFRQDH